MNVLISIFVLLSSFVFSSVYGFTVRVNKSAYAPKERITIFWTRRLTESFKMGFRMIRIPEGITQGRTYVVALPDMESEIAELDAPTLPGRFVVELFDNSNEDHSAPAQAKTPEFKVVGPDGSTGEPTTKPPPPPPPPPTITSKTETKTTANEETKTTPTPATTSNTTPGFVGTSGSSSSSSSSSSPSTHSFTSGSGTSPSSLPTDAPFSSSNQPSSLPDTPAAGSASKPQVGLIAGAAVGGAAAVLILLAIIFLLRRRTRSKLKLSDNFSEPLHTSPSPSVPAEFHRPIFYPQSADDSTSYPPSSSFSDSTSGGTRQYGHGQGFPYEKGAYAGGSTYNTPIGGDMFFGQSDSDRDGRAGQGGWSRSETPLEPLTSGGSTSSPSIMSAEAPSAGPPPNLLDRLQEFGVRSANDWPIVAEALGLMPPRPPSASGTEAPPPAYDGRSRLSRF